MDKFRDFIFTVVFVIWLCLITVGLIYCVYCADTLSRGLVRVIQTNAMSEKELDKFAGKIQNKFRAVDFQINALQSFQNTPSKKR